MHGFTPAALAITHALDAATEALLNIAYLARKEGANVYAELTATGEARAASWVDFVASHVADRCEDPECASKHIHTDG